MDNKLPKTLIFDIETAPMRAYVWGRWKQNISLSQTISEWFILCWSAKWLNSDDVISDCLTSEEAKEEFDYRIVKHLWDLIDEADIVVAYNGKKADIPWMNTRFIYWGIEPPTTYKVVDPCETARKVFDFSSNKLDALAGYFNIPHKMGTDFSLWDNACRGDGKSLNYMSLYCSKDVEILERVYLKLLPWVNNHPNITNLTSTNKVICSHCGSTDVRLLPNKYYYTALGKYSLYRCDKCHSLSKGRVNLNKKTTVSTVG